MEFLSSEDGTLMCGPPIFKYPLSPYLLPILLDYVDRTRLHEVFNNCMTLNPRSYTTEAASAFRWNIRRRPNHVPFSNMYWISPAEICTHHNLLSVLSVGGFGSLLSSLVAQSGGDVCQLSVFQMTFLVVSSCGELQFHVDFDESLVGSFWSVIIPIRLVMNSPPELVAMCKKSGSTFDVKYHLGQAVIFGPDVVHSTALVAYSHDYRVCLSINIGCIKEYNVDLILTDITQQFPPKSRTFLLQWANKYPHWHVTSQTNLINIPSITVAGLLGSEWLSNYQELRHIYENDKKPFKFSKKLLQWIGHQRYFYVLKYMLSPMDNSEERLVSRIKATRYMSRFREAKLREIDFQFVVQRDAGCNQVKWMTMFNELKSFFRSCHHFKVNRLENPKLYGWLCTQKRVLSVTSSLSSAKAKRRDLLVKLGFLK